MANVPFLVRATTPVDNVKVINSELKNTKLRFADRGVPGIVYPPVDLEIKDCAVSGDVSVSAVEGRKVLLSESGNSTAISTVGDVDMI